MTDCTCNNFPSSLGNVTFGANVGIATANPLQKLQIGDGLGGGSMALVINGENGGGNASEVRLFDPALPVGAGYNYLKSTYGGDTEVGSYWGINFVTNTSGRVGDPVGQHSFAFRSGATTLMTVRDDGKVGIGTIAPSSALEIQSGAITTLTIDGGGTFGAADKRARLNFDMGATTEWQVGTGMTGNLADEWGVYETGYAIRFIIKAGGSVGIGATDPQARLHVGGDAKLDGPLAQIHGRPNVGLASNGFDDLILNFNGAAYWFKGTQGGGSQGGGTQLMKLDVNGDLTVLGKVQAANTVKTWDSGWFDVTALGTYDLSHTLGVVPNLIQFFFRESSSSTHFMVLEGFLWGDQAVEYGAYVRAITASALQVVVRNKIGRNDAGNGWLTSGQVKVIAWA